MTTLNRKRDQLWGPASSNRRSSLEVCKSEKHSAIAVRVFRSGQNWLGRRLINFVPILYRKPAFGAFDDFSDFVESVSYGASESCQVRGSKPCRGAKLVPVL